MRDEIVRGDSWGKGGRISSFRDLLVWQKAMQLVRSVYLETRRFPKEEMFGLVAQVRRAAVSIPSNIAEGYGRNSPGDYIRFLSAARGSLYELETQAEISRELGYLSADSAQKLVQQTDELGKMSNALISKLKVPSA